ncbi:MAG: TIGR01777 family oxidoreductase [Bacteroidales bacterium]|nr:TIGR01777 family oxidoreductase [Bacteroidales bacterium]
MQVFITGANGFIGNHLVSELLRQDVKVIAASRNEDKAGKALPAGVRVAGYGGQELREALSSSDVVVNLAGESISGGRWTNKKKASVMNSRLNTAQRLLHAVKSLNKKDLVFIQASAIGYYGNSSELNRSEGSEAGDGFLAEVCQKWEAHMPEMATCVKRAITLRFGVVLGKEGGMLPEMLKQSKRGTAGKAGNGKQWISWIHIYDLVHAIIYLINDDKAGGVYNLVAPEPIQQKEFSRLLARFTGRKIQLPAPAFLIRLVLGKMGKELVLSGQHVSAAKLLRKGFVFKFDKAADAMKYLIKH